MVEQFIDKQKIKIALWRSAILIFIILIVVTTITVSSNLSPPTSPNKSPSLDIRGITRDSHFYQESFTRAATQSGQLQLPADTAAIIIPHHLLAEALIQETLQGLSRSPSLIVLVSPDHFSQTSTNYLGFATDADWQTPFGQQKGFSLRSSDQEQLSSLDFTKQNYFQIEHGLYGVVPFLQAYFPESSLLAIALQSNANADSIYQLGQQLKQLLRDKNLDNQNTLLVLSSDFAHHATTDDADLRDAASIATLQELSPDTVNQVDNDCHSCLSFALGFLNEPGEDQPKISFTPLNNKNSHDFGGTATDITSYVTAYAGRVGATTTSRRPTNPITPTSWVNTPDYALPIITGTLIAGGDVMLARSINTWQTKHQDYTLAWQGIAPILQAADLALINLETPIITDCPLTDEGMMFCAPLAATAGLKAAGIDVVNLANNHTLNHGRAGLAETRAALDLAAVSFVGEHGNGYGSLVIKNIDALKIGFLGFDDVSQTLDQDMVTAQIRQARAEVDTLVTTWHWGSEYTARPNARQVTLAHLAIENGADLVIGHHPHWVQTSEVYLDRHIYYSLGNLIFDQFWSEPTQHGLLVKLQLTAQQTSPGNYNVHWQPVGEIEVSIYPPGQPKPLATLTPQ